MQTELLWEETAARVLGCGECPVPRAEAGTGQRWCPCLQEGCGSGGSVLPWKGAAGGTRQAVPRRRWWERERSDLLRDLALRDLPEAPTVLEVVQAESVLSQVGNGDSHRDDSWKLVTSGNGSFFFLLCGWSNSGRGCPERFCGVSIPERYSEPHQTRLWAPCCSLALLSAGGWTRQSPMGPFQPQPFCVILPVKLWPPCYCRVRCY